MSPQQKEHVCCEGVDLEPFRGVCTQLSSKNGAQTVRTEIAKKGGVTYIVSINHATGIAPPFAHLVYL